jgi:two-component system, LytTR family, response regulator
MALIKAIIIDDEENNCLNLRNMLNRYCPEVEVAAYALSASEGFELIKASKPDVVFLDIEMPGGTGFDLLQMTHAHDFDVVFVTAFDQYAIRAIRFCAIDYLLKPVDYKELVMAVNRVISRKNDRQKIQLSMQNYVENIGTSKTERKIALVSSNRNIYVKVKEIIRCEGENNYTRVFVVNGEKVLVTRTLKDFEELLEDSGFIRVHQSHLINMDHIHSFEKKDGGYILMCDKSVVHISRQRKEKVMKMLAGWKM